MKEWRAINLLMAILVLLLFNGHFLVGSLKSSFRSAFVFLFTVWLLAALYLYFRAHFNQEGDL